MLNSCEDCNVGGCLDGRGLNSFDDWVDCWLLGRECGWDVGCLEGCLGDSKDECRDG